MKKSNYWDIFDNVEKEKRLGTNKKQIAKVKKDLDRCIVGDLAKHNKVGVIITALVKKLDRMQKGVDISGKVFYSRFNLNERR